MLQAYSVIFDSPCSEVVRQGYKLTSHNTVIWEIPEGKCIIGHSETETLMKVYYKTLETLRLSSKLLTKLLTLCQSLPLVTKVSLIE